MKNLTRAFALSTIVLAMVSGSAYAADRPDCTTIQGFSGHTGHDLYPGNCQDASAVSGKSRQAVRAELVNAQRNGDIVVGMGFTQRELSNTTTTTDAGGKTREQVKAELAEAQRNGDIVVGMGFTQRELSNGTLGVANLASNKTRDQVNSELAAWRKEGASNN